MSIGLPTIGGSLKYLWESKLIIWWVVFAVEVGILPMIIFLMLKLNLIMYDSQSISEPF